MEPSYPVQRCKPGWTKQHARLVEEMKQINEESTLFIGDSIIQNFNKYPKVFKTYFKNAINVGLSGDRTQHVLWRLKSGLLPLKAKLIIVHVGTNNLGKNRLLHIAEAIVEIVNTPKENDAQIVVTVLLPRGMYPCTTSEDITSVNLYLENLLHNHAPKALYVAPESDWTHPDGRLNMKFFFLEINCTSARKGIANFHSIFSRYWLLLLNHLQILLLRMSMQ